MSAWSLSYPSTASSPRKRAARNETPGLLGARGCPLGGSNAGAPGAARLMSHHMGNFVYARHDEYLPLAACFAFERAAFDVSCVHRLDQSDRSLPAACGAQSSGAHGGRLGGMHVVSFPCGTLGVSVESTSAAWTEPVPVDQSSLCNIDHFPNLELKAISPAHSARDRCCAAPSSSSRTARRRRTPPT